MLAECPDGGKADPAFPAHESPIGQWAQAVWEDWLPRRALMALATNAKRKVQGARCIWKVVVGPGSALVATAARLNWDVIDAVSLVTDQGESLTIGFGSTCRGPA